MRFRSNIFLIEFHETYSGNIRTDKLHQQITRPSRKFHSLLHLSISIMLIFCSQIYSVGQDLNLLWAKQIGRKNYDGPVTSMTVDNDGNVLTIGTFWNQGLPLDFDPNSGVVELTAKYNNQISIVKFTQLVTWMIVYPFSVKLYKCAKVLQQTAKILS